MEDVPIIRMSEVCNSTRLHENPLYPENKSPISGETFRELHLAFIDDEELWYKHKTKKEPFVILDFSDIVRVGPRFLNEAFAYFRKFGYTEEIMKKIKFVNIKDTHKAMIEVELDYGYLRDN